MHMGRKLTVLWDEREVGNSVMLFTCFCFCCCPSQCALPTQCPIWASCLKNENPSLRRNALVEMTIEATGASAATSLKRIVGEKDGTKSPAKSRPKRKKAFNKLDEFNFGVFRRMMQSFYTRGGSPLAKLHKKLIPHSHQTLSCLKSGVDYS